MKIGWFPVVTDSIESQRDKESKSQRDKESKRERDGGSILAWSAVRLRRCIRMAKMQGAEDEGAGIVLKYMTKPNPIATKQIGYYDTPPPKFSTPNALFRF